MSSQPRNNQPDRPSIRRIVLPSGRTIEVVRFLGDSAGGGDSSGQTGLHVCPECDSPLVQPIAWTEAPQSRWELVLQCPNCFWRHEDVFEQDQVDVLEERLDDGLTTMLTDLRRLTESNMNEEVHRFAAALEADLILPEDF